MTPTTYLLLYSLLWLLSVIVYKFQYKGSTLGLGLLLLWFFSSVTSIWMIHQRYYYQSALYVFDIVSFVPLVYLWVTVLMYSFPVLVLKIPTNSYMLFCTKSDKNVKKTIVNVVVILFIILSISKFYILLQMPNSFSFLDSHAGSLAKEKHMLEITEKLFSSQLGVYSNKLTSIFRDSMLCFAFYFTSQKKYKKAVMLFLCCVALPFYEGILLGSRQQIICLVMNLFITYQLFNPFLEEGLKLKIKKIFVLLLVATSVPLIVISLLRFGDYTDFVVYEILRYFGESSVNFASWLFPHLVGQDNGRQILSTLFRDLSFYKNIQTIGPWFYSFVGNLVMAWGRLFTFFGGILFCIMAIWQKAHLHSQKMSVGKAILLQTIAIMCYEGLFAFIHWLYFGGFVVGLLWIIILDSNWFTALSQMTSGVFHFFKSFDFIKIRRRYG